MEITEEIARNTARAYQNERNKDLQQLLGTLDRTGDAYWTSKGTIGILRWALVYRCKLTHRKIFVIYGKVLIDFEGTRQVKTDATLYTYTMEELLCRTHMEFLCDLEVGRPNKRYRLLIKMKWGSLELFYIRMPH